MRSHKHIMRASGIGSHNYFKKPPVGLLYDFYLASPFFNDEQMEREDAIKATLRDKGYTVFSPIESTFVQPESDVEEQKNCFRQNLDAIDRSLFVFVITNGKDMGTIFEAGYAYGISKPVIYFCEGLDPKMPFNLMLAQSAYRVFISRKELIECCDVTERIDYRGMIE